MLKVYPVSEDATNIGGDNLIFSNVLPMLKEECILRVYIIRGIELQAKDSNGKSDAYIELRVGKLKVDSRDNYIPNSINPEFGRMFELKVTLPLQKDLCIRVKDYDLISSDETIGETWIDLENRLLTKHRGTVGLPIYYNESGPNRWRDSQRPSQILAQLCKARNLEYVAPGHGETSLKIEKNVFNLEKYEKKPPKNAHFGSKDERLCLYVLHEFNLVPEHVETRKLYNPIQPGMEQGSSFLLILIEYLKFNSNFLF
jgi:myoferlin